MSGTVLVSTHALRIAGPLRDAFRSAGYAVELITPGENIVAVEAPVLLIVTGEVASLPAREMARQARDKLGIPVFGILNAEDREGGRRLVRELGLAEVFSPVVDADEVLLLGRRLIERQRLQRVTGIVGETDVIREALERVVQIAPVQSTVLVTGESGTGKELVARGIHALSPRRHRAFLGINVAALPDTLLESELFGHEKGAFTGAIDARKGFFELAHQGTIFLDEIGEMPLATQTKLLRVLEQREFLRVGGENAIKIDVRIIAATNQDLRRLVAEGGFRQDLYYRVNVLNIELPPLRERRDDIPLLVHAFIEEITTQLGRPFAGISREAMDILKAHHWPGNVRELRNLIESMVVLSPGREIRAEDIPQEVRSPRPGTLLLPPSTGTALQPSQPRRESSAGEVQRVEPSLRPELEFVFRTLVELRVDMDQLQRDFTAYREDLREVQDVTLPSHDAYEHARDVPHREIQNENMVVFRPGMTMEELEREAIVAVLRKTQGNRRQASELLGIGERTLYRKIRHFDLDE